METIEVINKRLFDIYGYFADTDKPKYRLSWSDDQFEKRMGEFEDRTSEGFFIRRVTEVREIPKYKPSIKERWLLEYAVEYPANSGMLEKFGYECLYKFENKYTHEMIYPKWIAIEYILKGKLESQEETKIYKEKSGEEVAEIRKARILELKEALFGNDTRTNDALHYGEGVVVPGNYKNEKESERIH